MKPRWFAKVFFATAIPFGLMMGLLLGAAGAALGTSPANVWSPGQGAAAGFVLGLLILGPLYGAMMAAITGVMHFSLTDDPAVRHRSTLVVSASPEEAWDMCVEAMQMVPGLAFDASLPGQWRVSGKKAPTSRSWGDVISCDIQAVEAGQRIVVQSRPRIAATVVDYGSNLENVQMIASHLVSRGARVLDNA